MFWTQDPREPGSEAGNGLIKKEELEEEASRKASSSVVPPCRIGFVFECVNTWRPACNSPAITATSVQDEIKYPRGG